MSLSQQEGFHQPQQLPLLNAQNVCVEIALRAALC
jgi:hypothetical protein